MAHELMRLLKRNQEIANGTLRKLQFYRLAVELEQMKEPTSKEWYDMPWTLEPLSVRFVNNAEFKKACKEDREKKFPQDVCVALFVSDGETEHPLFQCVHQYSDIKDMDLDDADSALISPLSEFSVCLSAAGEMELDDGQIDALEQFLHEGTPTLDALKKTIGNVIGAETALVETLRVALSSKNPALSQLVSELKRLGQEANLAGVVAEFLENRGFKNRIEDVNPDRLVALTPMDDAQRNAVALSLGSRVSVVTGPPGCGKTQVILNILANAVLRGKTVLVSSKNNKAVDNVRDRLIREPGLENAIVRFGSQSVKAAQTIPGLKAMLSVAQQTGKRRSECEQALTEAKRVHDDACERLVRAKRLISERSELNAQLPSLRIARDEADTHAVEIEAWADRTAQDFLTVHAPYRVFDGYDEVGLDNIVTPFRRLRNAFSRKFSGIGKLWINWFTKRKHAAIALDAVMAFPMGIRKLADGATRHHAAEEFSSGNDVLEYYRDVDDELKAGLSYLDESAKLMEELSAKIDAAKAEAQEASRRVLECEDRLSRIAAERPDDMLAEASKTIQMNSSRYVGAAFAKKLSAADAPSSIVTFTNYVLGGAPWKYQEVKLFEDNVRKFLEVSPLMAITSLSAKGTLPLATDLVDMLIIDEASQCDVASALPLMFRARQIVVIGDPQQLRHISANNKEDEKAIKDHLKLVNVPYLRYAEASLWDCTRDWLTKASGQNAPLMLNGHYRCHKDIVEYSNQMFYRHMGGLVVRTPPFKNPIREQGCRWVDVKGEQVSNRFNVNYAEIDKAMQIALMLAKENPNISIGLVTPFRAQAEKMHFRIGQLPGEVKNRITASTVHKFQGDERDIMIYTLVVTSNSPASKINWIDEGAPNLVNVAVTRARQALYVIGNKEYVRSHSSPQKPLGALLRYIEGL